MKSAERELSFKLENLLRGQVRYMLVSSILAGTLAWMLSSRESVLYVGIWLAGVLATNFARGILGWIYSVNNQTLFGKEITGITLKNCHETVLILSGLAWGASCFLAVGNLTSELKVIFVGYLIAVEASGIVSNAVDKSSAILFLCCLAVPYGVRSFVEGGEYVYPYLAIQIGWFFLLVFLCIRFHDQLFRNFHLILEKEELLRQVREKFDLERELKEEKMKSLHASKFAAIGEMAAGVGHEINNPLTVVLGYHWRMEKLMLEGGDQEQVVKLLRKSTKACERIADIVQSMRDFSRMKERGELERFSLLSVVDMVRPLLDKSVANSCCELKINFEDRAVKGVKSEFAQVFFNLVSNALQACEGQESEIEVRGRGEAGAVFLEVSNPGAPISDEVQEKMFQPFFTTKEVGKGTGLGLSLAKTIMENNHGEIYYERRGERNVFVMKMLPG